MWEQILVQNHLVNCVPLSVTIVICTTCLQIAHSQNIFANSGDPISFQQGRYFGVLVDWSSMTQITVYRDVVNSGRSVTKPIGIPSPGFYMGCRGRLGPYCAWHSS